MKIFTDKSRRFCRRGSSTESEQKGVSLIITFFIMIIILSVVLFISVLLYNQVKIIKDIGNSVASLYAADSGIEKVLFYDRKVVPLLDDGVTLAARGLCSMFDSTNSNACGHDSSPSNPDIDHSIYCNGANNTPPTLPSGNDCGRDTCTDCSISFNTKFEGRTYNTTAFVAPSADGASSDFQIESTGTFGGAQRKIKILISAAKPKDAITIKSACAVPVSTPQGNSICICATVEAVGTDTIGTVVGTIHRLDAQNISIPVIGGDNISLVSPVYTDDTAGQCRTGAAGSPCGSDQWAQIWSTTDVLVGNYYLDIEAQDTLLNESNEPTNDKKCTNISSYICTDIPQNQCISTRS